MKQCKKILNTDTGEQCSNRAVPGTDYCEEHHRRIKFRRVLKEDVSSSLMPEKRPAWVARPSAAGEKPAFPGLLADERNILVGPQGIIRLSEPGTEDQTGTIFDRLVRLLACLSQEMPLPGHVLVWIMPEGKGVIVRIAPPKPEAPDLSRHYDLAAEAAALCGGRLYIGKEHAFIRYRDGSAPRGYDAKGVEVRAEDKLYLVDTDGTYPFAWQGLIEESLDKLLLRIPPSPARGTSLPETAYALLHPALYRMLARYFRAHHLRYKVARFHALEADPLVLFEIAPNPDASTGALVPAFVLSYLCSLPNCNVFTETGTDSGRHMLVQWGQRYPCRARHILDAFPSDCLVLLTTGPDFSNLCVSPAPAFFEGDDLISVRAPCPGQDDFKAIDGRDDLHLKVPVRLIHDRGSATLPAALILDTEETDWVRRLIYRLPGDAFGKYSFCLGQERSVLLGKGVPMELLPFGIPMQCVQDTHLFTPLRCCLVPNLPWKLLSEVLEIIDDNYTFLTTEFRLDVPRNAFIPLSHGLFVEPSRPRTVLRMREIHDLPALNWTAPPKPTQPYQETETPQSEPHVQRKTSQNVEGNFLERAESYRRAEDHLSAALCFALAKDKVNAARCYEEAARSIKTHEKHTSNG